MTSVHHVTILTSRSKISDELSDEREQLRHAEELLREVGGALEELDGDEGSALAKLHAAVRALERWEVRIAALAEPAESLRDASLHLSDAAEGMARFVDGIEVSQGRLEQVEGRLAVVERLAKKHGTDLAGLVALRDRLADELEELEGGAGSAEELEGEVRAALGLLVEAAAKLTKRRRALREKLKLAVEGSLCDLGLERAEFGVLVEAKEVAASDSPNAASDLTSTRRFGADGADVVAFQLAANPGEGLSPLAHVASGGEAARILLALRGALAARQTIPTLIFDEIDSGVGGRLAPRVGAHLRALGGHHQILCVTHLPAVAAAAHRHHKVEKCTEEGRTRTRVAELGADARVSEVADMIGGGAGAETARAEANRLLVEAAG